MGKEFIAANPPLAKLRIRAETPRSRKRMSLTRKILRGSTLNLVDHAVKTASMLVLTPFMVASLGMEAYGIWLLLTAAVSFLNLLDGGVTLSGTRYLARALGKTDGEEDCGNVVGTLRWLYQRIGLLCLLATGGLVAALPAFLKDPAWLDTGRWVVLALGGGAALRFFLRIHLVILKSHLRYDLIVAASLVKVLLQTGLLLTLLARGHGLTSLALAQLSTEVVDQLLVVLFSRRAGVEHAMPSRRCPALLAELLRYSFIALLNIGSHQLRGRMPPFVLTSFVGLASVPVFSMGQRLIGMFQDVINTAMGGLLLAGFSQVEGKHGLQAIREKFLLSLRFCAPIVLFGCASLAVLGPAFLKRWLGPGFEDSGTVLRALLLPYSIWLMQYPAESLFLSLNQHHLITRLTFLAGLMNVALSITLASWIGFDGVVWATCLEMTLFYGVGVPMMISRVLKMPLHHYYIAWLRPLLAPGALALILGLLLAPLAKPEYPILALLGGVLTLAFLSGGFWLVLGQNERAALLTRLLKRKSA